jgi:hypothetical protein
VWEQISRKRFGSLPTPTARRRPACQGAEACLEVRFLEVRDEVCYHAPVAYGPSVLTLQGRGALGRRGISSGGLRDVDGPVYLVGARLGLRHVPRGQALAVNP